MTFLEIVASKFSRYDPVIIDLLIAKYKQGEYGLPEHVVNVVSMGLEMAKGGVAQ